MKIIDLCDYLNGVCVERGLVSSPWQLETGQGEGNCLKLHKGRFRLDIGNFFFTEGVLKHWNRLSNELVKSLFLEVFKKINKNGTL